MKVLLVNTSDSGGAANSCRRLHLGLLEEGVTSNVLLRFKKNNWPKSVSFTQSHKKLTFLDKVENKAKRILKELKLYSHIDVSKRKQQHFLSQRDRNLEMFSFPNSDCDITNSEFFKEADIINLHWVANFLDYRSFFEINKKPVVWTLHDMNPFTGGEHYVEEFLGIDTAGYQIKRNLSEEEIKIANENLELKKEIFSKVSNLTVVTPSEWMAEEARKSQIFKKVKVYCIPNGVDTSIYSSRDKKYSKELFGIPKNKRVVLFVADSISNNRKGFVFLKRAFEQLSDPNLVLCVIGDKNTDLSFVENIYELGPIFDERLMSIVYSAADVFVIPSLMDNLPNTVIESLVCGTPVIGFPVGGIPDMIQDGINGFITKEVSVDSLVETLKKFLSNPNCFNGVEIRNNAVKKYDQSIQSQKYIDLFNNVINMQIIKESMDN